MVSTRYLAKHLRTNSVQKILLGAFKFQNYTKLCKNRPKITNS